MQARVNFQDVVSIRHQGFTVIPEIIIPLVGTPRELGHQVKLIRSVASKVFSKMDTTLNHKVGTRGVQDPSCPTDPSPTRLNWINMDPISLGLDGFGLRFGIPVPIDMGPNPTRIPFII
ncbi:hypothetical protein QQ045_030065 [Rhodiola kirilowii]